MSEIFEERETDPTSPEIPFKDYYSYLKIINSYCGHCIKHELNAATYTVSDFIKLFVSYQFSDDQVIVSFSWKQERRNFYEKNFNTYFYDGLVRIHKVKPGFAVSGTTKKLSPTSEYYQLREKIKILKIS